MKRPHEGDIITRGGQRYQVTEVKKKVFHAYRYMGNGKIGYSKYSFPIKGKADAHYLR